MHVHLVDLAHLFPLVRLDIRYATSNNFLGRPVYAPARALLQQPAAEALERAGRVLARQGFGLKVFDAYRPWSVTKVFWEAVTPEQRGFVANPSAGSRHNRGCAVDLTLVELHSGREVPMPSEYDEMSLRAYPYYPGGDPQARRHRDLLRTAMEDARFSVHPMEWWHFDFQGWECYPVMDIPFERLGDQPGPVFHRPAEELPSFFHEFIGP